MPYRVISTGALRGLNQDENPHDLAPGDLTVARNAARRALNVVGTRPGAVVLGATEDYADPLTGTPAIQGAVEYRQNFDEGRRLILVADHATNKVWYEDDSRLPAGAPPQIMSGADNIWTFGLHNNTLFAAGGAATDDIWTWDGNIANAPTVLALTDKLSTNRLRPKFVKAWRGYVLFNGFRGGTSATNNPACSRYQTFGQDATDDASYIDSNTLGFLSQRVGSDSYGGAFTTGFGTYQDNNGDFLLVLANSQIVSYILDESGTGDFIRNDVIANGCVHQRAFVDLGVDAGDAIYMSRVGVHSLRQSQQHGARESAFLSRKITPIIRSLNPNRIPFSCAAYDRINGRVVFVWSTGASTTHDILMALDVRNPESLNANDALWYGPWTFSEGISVNHIAYLRDESDNFHLYAFTTDGDVLRFAEDVFHDRSADPIDVEMRTKDEAYGSILTTKRCGDTVVQLAPGGNHAVQWTREFNYGNKTNTALALRQPATNNSALPQTFPFELGSGQIISDVKGYTSGEGRTVADRFAHNAADQPFFIGRIDRQIAGGGEDPGASQTEAA